MAESLFDLLKLRFGKTTNRNDIETQRAQVTAQVRSFLENPYKKIPESKLREVDKVSRLNEDRVQYDFARYEIKNPKQAALIFDVLQDKNISDSWEITGISDRIFYARPRIIKVD